MIMKLFRRGPSCEEVLEVLQAYLDGETDEATARNVIAHLDRCALCEHELYVYRRIKISLTRHTATVDPEVLSALTLFGERVARGEIPGESP